jgi:hypothetical protein
MKYTAAYFSKFHDLNKLNHKTVCGGKLSFCFYNLKRYSASDLDYKSMNKLSADKLLYAGREGEER